MVSAVGIVLCRVGANTWQSLTKFQFMRLTNTQQTHIGNKAFQRLEVGPDWNRITFK